MLRITLYAKPGCFGCRKTAEKFTAAGIPFDEVDLTTTPAALEYVTEDLGYSQAPIVVVDEHFHWSGLRPDMIDRAVAAASAPASAQAGALAGAQAGALAGAQAGALAGVLAAVGEGE